MISEKKLINDLEKMYNLLNFESLKIMIYIIPTKNLVQKRNSDLKQHYTVMRLRKFLKAF